jgi:hypothetical protein
MELRLPPPIAGLHLGNSLSSPLDINIETSGLSADESLASAPPTDSGKQNISFPTESSKLDVLTTLSGYEKSHFGNFITEHRRKIQKEPFKF